MQDNVTESQLKAKFKEIAPELEAWGQYIDSVLNDFVEHHYSTIKEMIQFKASCRVKDEESFIQKALYRNKNYHSPIIQITDKVGTRLVLLCSIAVTEVADFIQAQNKRKWIVKEHSQEITKIRVDKPEEFTYQSEHYIVKPCDDYDSPIDNEVLTCEIQVRTLLQHAYSEISHAFVYKKNKDADSQVRRKLAASMAFLEEADEKFLFIYDRNMDGNNEIRPQLVDDLNSEYAKFNANYQIDKFDREALDVYFQLLDDYKLKEIYESLSAFCQEKGTEISMGIKQYHDCYLFTQPILLLALFSFDRWKNFTRNNWPYSYESLKLVVSTLGVSDDMLD